MERVMCGEPTDICYPAQGGGWMALCIEHGAKHVKNGAQPVSQLIAKGETFEGFIAP